MVRAPWTFACFAVIVVAGSGIASAGPDELHPDEEIDQTAQEYGGASIVLPGIPMVFNVSDYCGDDLTLNLNFLEGTGFTCEEAVGCDPMSDGTMNMTSVTVIDLRDDPHPALRNMNSKLIMCWSGPDSKGYRYVTFDLTHQHEAADGYGTYNGDWAQVSRIRIAGSDHAGSFYRWSPLDDYVQTGAGSRSLALSYGPITYSETFTDSKKYVNPIHTWSEEASWSSGPRGYSATDPIDRHTMRVGATAKVGGSNDLVFDLEIKSHVNRQIPVEDWRFTYQGNFILASDGTLSEATSTVTKHI